MDRLISYSQSNLLPRLLELITLRFTSKGSILAFSFMAGFLNDFKVSMNNVDQSKRSLLKSVSLGYVCSLISYVLSEALPKKIRPAISLVSIAACIFHQYNDFNSSNLQVQNNITQEEEFESY